MYSTNLPQNILPKGLFLFARFILTPDDRNDDKEISGNTNSILWKSIRVTSDPII